MPNEILGTLNQISQIGMESAPGTAVPATRKLTSMGLPMTRAYNIQEFRPRGSKFATAHALNQEWSEGEIDDESGCAYNEIQYVLASLFSKPAPTTPLSSPAITRGLEVKLGEGYVQTGRAYRVTQAGTTHASSAPTYGGTTKGQTVTDGNAIFTDIGTSAGTGYRWTFDMSTYSRDDVQTYTIETGDVRTNRAYRSAFCYFTGMELESSRADEVSLSGDIVGNQQEARSLTDLSASPEKQLIPATPAHLNIYMDDTAAALGTTQLDGNFTATVSISDRATQAWFHGRQHKGPAGRVETAPEATFELVQADGEEVDKMLLGLAENQRKFFRFEWVGPEVVVGVRNMIQFDIAGNIGDAPEWDDEDGVYAATIPFSAEHDGAWGRAMRCVVVNGESTL